ncbi:VanZ family protein [Microbacterium sp. KUDC0406]|uniref:VanZ family protein n=1 Tax=Microbacterium sp. KUDC0406 TaxID=2909588 RepID=UPI001F1E2720|nr:VanZ family protein [Microbacterium sp. KUDC0406]UJP09506.1 VanZ family protein [Microbacterium sp. KUDC0406]
MTSPIPTPSPPSSVAPRVFVTMLALAGVLALTVAPRRIVAPARGAFMHLAHVWAGPVVEPMTFLQIEGTLNALLFVPLGAALALLLSRRWWILAPLIAFALSFGVETIQARIPGRVPDLGDVLWNTAGALAGAIVAGLVRLLRDGLTRARRVRRSR